MADHRADHGTDRPEPVLRAGTAAGVIGALSTLVVGGLVAVGWLSVADAPAAADVLGALGVAVLAVVNVAVPIAKARQARAEVTPLEAPAVQLPDGRVVDAELVPVIDPRSGDPNLYGTRDPGSPYRGQYPAG